MLGFAPQDCIVVEDASAGVCSGKAAGARVLAVQSTETNERLIELGADWIIKDCSSLAVNGATESGDLILEATLAGAQPPKG